MTSREEARNAAMELALEGKGAEEIGEILAQRGTGGLLHPGELEAMVFEANLAKRVMEPKPGTKLPRILGIFAILNGLIGIWIGTDGPHIRGYSPAGFGWVAVILGLILVFKPGAAREKL